MNITEYKDQRPDSGLPEWYENGLRYYDSFPASRADIKRLEAKIDRLISMLAHP